jgi:DNA/RNA endonuclease YhcR with UshA esterase domain
MRITFLNVLAIGAGLMLTSVPAFSHHSFAAEYDANKPVTLTGTVTKIEWMNPHARFYIDVKDDKGEIANWELELGSPNGLMRAGWTRNSLKKGDVVTVTGSLAKDGSKLANARQVILADGTQVLGASSQGNGSK